MFYHLTRSSPEDLLGTLVPRALAQGWHVAIRSPNRATLERLDDLLWTQPEDGFLPHAIACGGSSDRLQRVLLTQGTDLPNAARYVIALDGADLLAAEVAAVERACLVFDAQDGAQMDHARGLWKTLTAQGVAAQYWSEESGAWAMKTERRPVP